MDASKLTRAILKFTLITIGILAFPFVIYAAGYIGFALDFQQFGNSENQTMYMVILPLLVIAGTVFGLSTLAKRRRAAQKEQLRDEIHTEMKLPGEQETQLIIRALEQHGKLSLDEIASLTNISKQDLLPRIQSLLTSGVVLQHASLDGAQLELRK